MQAMSVVQRLRGESQFALVSNGEDAHLIALVFGLDEAAELWLVEHLPSLSAAELEGLTMRLLETTRRLLEPQPGGDP